MLPPCPRGTWVKLDHITWRGQDLGKGKEFILSLIQSFILQKGGCRYQMAMGGPWGSR